ncbi:rhomboid-like protein [Streptomyces sp. TP-A0356]|uniref:rhomboid-like protein n=1 Tax=Streptomyces sp. TP-A0356 TaxID=1359208 RepID=UPI001F33B099|nr:rhomboid-like protein [Streptomyces sp. TP-A0356]
MPGTAVYVTALLVTAWWLKGQPAAERARFVRHNSSNVHHLDVGKWWTLFTSGLVVDGVPALVGIAAVAAVLGCAEWRWGTLRACAVFVYGHLTATLLTEGFLWLMHAVRLPGVPIRARDVGISYGLVTTAACLLALAGGRLRRCGLPLLTSALTAAFLYDQELADAGHLISLALGALAAQTGWLRITSHPAQAAPGAPASPGSEVRMTTPSHAPARAVCPQE